MAKTTGIGGLFFRARDPEALSAWYAEHLGVGNSDDGTPWQQEAGFTVFAPFAEDSTYFPADRPFMLNFRVDDLDAMIRRLETAGIAIRTEPEWDTQGVGRFARIHDPEGTPIELWEPTS